MEEKDIANRILTDKLPSSVILYDISYIGHSKSIKILVNTIGDKNCRIKIFTLRFNVTLYIHILDEIDRKCDSNAPCDRFERFKYKYPYYNARYV